MVAFRWAGWTLDGDGCGEAGEIGVRSPTGGGRGGGAEEIRGGQDRGAIADDGGEQARRVIAVFEVLRVDGDDVAVVENQISGVAGLPIRTLADLAAVDV